MTQIVDNLIAFRILNLLVTPFKESSAFKMGIIDENGEILKYPKTGEEKDSYSYLHRLVFKLKGMLSKLPGGDSKLKNIVAAWYLIKESYNNGFSEIDEERLGNLIDLNIVLKKEILDFFEEVPVNHSGEGVSTDTSIDVKQKIVSGKWKKWKKEELKNVEDRMTCLPG